MKLFGLFFILGPLLALPACNGGGRASDAAFDADADRPTDDGDHGGDGDGPPYRLVFLPGAQACARFSVLRTATQELALRGLLRFRTVTIELPRQGGDFETELLDSAEQTGPRPLTAEIQGPARVTHARESGLWGFCDRYTVEQSATVASRAFLVKGVFSFCTRDGVADPEELVFDADRVGEDPLGLVEAVQVELQGFLDDGSQDGQWDYHTEIQYYGSCTWATLPRFRITAGLENGGSVILEKRFLRPTMGTGPAAIMSAEVELDGQQQIIDDYFRLAYSADLHNLLERYLVVLDPPLGQIHAVYLAEGDSDAPPTAALLLDDKLDPARPIGQRRVSTYREESW